MALIPIKYYFEYYALRGVAALVRSLPRRKALAFGRAFGRLGMKVLPGRYHLAKRNIELALPELDPSEVEAVVAKNFESIGVGGVEMLCLDMFDHEDFEQYFDAEGIDHLHEAVALNRGVILLTGHLGFWEAGHFVMSELGIPTAAVAKPLKNPLSEKYFAAVRESFGTEMINSRRGARHILKALQKNRAVVILLDQHISPPGSIPTTFFGRQAYTTTAITTLAMKHQVPIVPMFCLREKDDRYKVWAEPMVILEKDHSVAENTQQLTTIIETAVRKDVNQWFWVHKRWRVEE